MHASRILTGLAFTFFLAACGDAPVAPRVPADAAVVPSISADREEESGAGGSRKLFDHYVAVGTSLSMGWRSDGVLAQSQETAWPAQLGLLAGHQLRLPLIAFPGCGAPLAAPLASGVRVSGEPAAASFDTRVCAPNLPGITLPGQNVAIVGARTDLALLQTPEVPDFYQRVYQRVLPAGMTQVTAMMAQHPRLVSVELGANEVLGVTSGAYVPGQTVIPVGYWAPYYHQVLDSVQKTARFAVVTGLIEHTIDLPAFRRGSELWNARATFAPFNVAVSTDCHDSRNALFVPVIVPTAVATGAYYAGHGFGVYTLSCADHPDVGPDGVAIRDYVLSATDLAAADAQLAQMNAIIRQEADRRGFAYFALSALYERVNVKPAFSATALMTSTTPYGPLISLDGIHPSAAGSTVLALAAARALEQHYRFRRFDFDGDDRPLVALSH